MFDKSTRFKQVCKLLLSLIVEKKANLVVLDPCPVGKGAGKSFLYQNQSQSKM